MTNILGTHDAVGLAELVRSGEVSARELTEAALARVEATDAEYNAVVQRLDDRARAQTAGDLPTGPFTGVPMMIKDLYAPTAGDPMHNGNKAMRDANWTATEDSDIVKLYRNAGFVFVGRTNTPELGLVGTTEPLSHGPTRNPWNPEHCVGGSSGGSAAAVAAGMVPLAHASDGGGSIRIPAAMCGLVGLKPSRGRIPMGPAGEEWGLSIQHVVTKSVRDAAAMLDVSSVHSPGDGVVAPANPRPWIEEVGRDPGRLRIAMIAEEFRDDIAVNPEIVAMTRAVAQRLEALGHDVFEARPPHWSDPSLQRQFMAMWAVNAANNIAKIGALLGRELTEDDMEISTWLQVQAGRAKSGLDLMASMDAMAKFRRDTADWWAANCDLMLTPTCAKPAPVVGDMVSSPDEPMRGSTLSKPYAVFTSPLNVTGQPAVSLPMGLTEAGLPIGAQLVAAYGREDLLLQVSSQLEEHFVPLAPATRAI